MSQPPRWCQSHVAQIFATGFLAVIPFMAQPVTAAAQKWNKVETDAAVTLARETVAARFSVPLDQIRTITVSPAQWRDSSLGCPERGMIYTPALSSGYVLILRDGEREHVVHVGGGRAVICNSKPDPKPPAFSAISASLKAADAVRTAVAARLGIERSAVRIASTRPVASGTGSGRSSSGSLSSCPAAPVPPNSGALIVEAEAAAQTFRYYADGAQVVNCDDSGRKDEQRPGDTEKK
jgi:hypothetical protein